MVVASRILAMCIVPFLLVVSTTVNADDGVLIGFFLGNEPRSAAVGDDCEGDGSTYQYQVIDPVTVSMTGDYRFSDAGHHIFPIDTQLAVYSPDYDPANPAQNRVGFVTTGNPIHDAPVSLQSGVQYVFVVQGECNRSNRDGRWSFTYSGPGTLMGENIYPAPAYSIGNFDGSDPSLPEEAFCGVVDYQTHGPIRVPQTGTYYFSDSSIHYDMDMALLIHSAPFDPGNPFENRVAGLDDGGEVMLEKGQDYYFVIQPMCENATGDFFFVLLGPSSIFQITEGVNGAWVNLDTLGQGILVDVYPNIDLFFAALFTFDTTPADGSETAVVGEPNHRWVTAQGPIDGDTVALQVYRTSGGLFDDPAPTDTEAVGTMDITFSACNKAELDYNFSGHSGSYSLVRLADGNNVTCQQIMNRLAVPFESAQ